MHGLDRLSILPDDAVQGTLPFFDIPFYPAQDPLVGICVHKDLEIHEFQQRRLRKDHDPLQDDDRIRRHQDRPVRPVMDGIIIDRYAYASARLEFADVLTQQFRVEGVRMVILALALWS